MVTIMVTKRPCAQSIFYRREGHSNGHAYTQSLVKFLKHDDKKSACAIPSSYRNFQSCPNAECRL